MAFDESVLTSEERAIFALRSLYKNYGYSQFKMSKFEEYDLYSRNKDFLISDSVITFTDTNGKLMALKPDVTLSIIKNYTSEQGSTQKLFYNENVYRVSSVSHTYKEILQTGLECLGDVDNDSLCEVLTLAQKSLALLSDNYVLDISHMGIVTGLLSEIDIPDSGKQEIVKCIGEKNLHTLQAICERYEVSDEDTQRLSGLVSIYGPIKTALPKIDKLCTNETMKSAVAELRNICKVLDNDNTNLDFSVVNDMKYYNGIVFQGFVDGIPEGILSGGQYDKLMKQMGKCSSAIGFAVYIDLLERFKSIKGEQN